MIETLLRGVAIAIAVAALLDPPVTMKARGRPRVAVIRSDQAQSLNPAIRTTFERLQADLRADFDIVAGRDDGADAAVVVGDRYPAAAMPVSQRIFTVTVAPAATEPNVRVSAIRSPREAARGTLIHLEVDVDGSNVGGVTSSLVVRAGQTHVEVGRATHTWAGREERWRTSIDVTPLDSPPWLLHVDVGAAVNERMLSDNSADVLVNAAEPLRVLVYDLRPSWASTFVRRALESDARFEVGSVVYPSRGVKISAGAGESLQSISLDGVRAIVVGGLERLTARDAEVLDRFLREREGSVVLLPDTRRAAQTARQWLPLPDAAEVLLEKPDRLLTEPPLPAFEVSEMLTFRPSPGARVLARAGNSKDAVVTVTPHGGGRLLVSGALDAWRSRTEANSAFDRFWQSAVGGAALAARPGIDVQVVPAIVRPGERTDVLVRVRPSAPGTGPANAPSVSAALNTGQMVRLWPEAEPGTFRGSFVAPRAEGVGRVTVSLSSPDVAPDNPEARAGPNGATPAASFMVASDAHTASSAAPPLALLAESRGGINVTASALTDLERRLRQDIASPAVRVERRPMRSAWWMLPFAACLGAEWWLRRRRGLR